MIPAQYLIMNTTTSDTGSSLSWGAFHLAKIFGLKFRKVSVSKGKAFSTRAKNLQYRWSVMMAQDVGVSASRFGSSRNGNFVQMEQ